MTEAEQYINAARKAIRLSELANKKAESLLKLSKRLTELGELYLEKAKAVSAG